MTESNTVKEQRDRFLAFSFASADMFIEVSAEGKIRFALGAVKGLTGTKDKDLVGRHWLELFSVYEQSAIQHMLETAKPGARCGPRPISLSETLGGAPAILSAIKMPGDQKYYLSFALSNQITDKLLSAIRNINPDSILTKREFVFIIPETVQLAKSRGQDISLTLIDIPKFAEHADAEGEDIWVGFVNAVHSFLIGQSIDGRTAARLEDGKYAIVHTTDTDAAIVKKKIESFADEFLSSQHSVLCEATTLKGNINKTGNDKIHRAAIYATDDFLENGLNISISNLNEGVAQYLESNKKKYDTYKGYIERVSFKILFQPIVKLDDTSALFYELFCKFEEGNTQDWVMFGEDAGLSPDLDLAMCERAVNYISFKAGGTRTKFSLNVSSRSFESEKFKEKFLEQLQKKPNIENRLIIELRGKAASNSSHQLSQLGFENALDEFNIETANLTTITNLPIKYIKLDSKIFMPGQMRKKTKISLEKLMKICKKNEITLIAKNVEDIYLLERVKKIGFKYAQGYVFGQPDANPLSPNIQN